MRGTRRGQVERDQALSKGWLGEPSRLSRDRVFGIAGEDGGDALSGTPRALQQFRLSPCRIVRSDKRAGLIPGEARSRWGTRGIQGEGRAEGWVKWERREDEKQRVRVISTNEVPRRLGRP